MTLALSSGDDASDASKEVGSPFKASEEMDSTITSSFGESVPYVPPTTQSSEPQFFALDGDSAGGSSDAAVAILEKSRLRNAAVAIASFAVAIFNYGWQFSHPVTSVEILASMQSQSAPLAAIGNNGKPTVIDFW